MKTKAAFLILSLLPFGGTAAFAADTETAIFAGGCFWCVESDFESVAGVTEATSGYIGGSAKTATYKQIGKGGTGHYEAVKIEYDPAVVSYGNLVDIFWRSIDPIDAGGQFCDRGESYKSAIFALNKAQQKIAQSTKKTIDDSGRLAAPIVTKILPADTFYPAEEYHQNYYKKSDIVFTRFGPIKKKSAYKKYRKSCGRDARVAEVWGKDAFVSQGH